MQGDLERPRSTTIGLRLLYVSLALGAANALAGDFSVPPGVSATFVYVVVLAGLAVSGLLIFLIGTGRNWARILYVALFLVSLPQTLPLAWEIATSLSHGPVWFALWLPQWPLFLVGVGLLFLPVSNAWFRAARARRRDH